MTKPVLAIDIDDVLYPFSKHFLMYANEKLGQNKTLTDMVSYRLDTLYSVSYLEIIDLLKDFMNEAFIMDLEPLPDSVAAIKLLHKQYDLQIITARLSAYREITERWIDKYFPNLFSDMHYCDYYALSPKNSSKTTKLEVCKKIGARCLIDDNPDNVAQAMSGGVMGILFGEYAWHSELPEDCHPTRMASWTDALKKDLWLITVHKIKKEKK